jgi:hypothetical protein
MAVLSGCFSTSGPRQDVMERDLAARDHRPLRVRIVAVYDNQGLAYTTTFRVSHVIDVDVLDGPEGLVGKPLCLPYDEFNVTRPPPLVGDVMTITPADWVNPNPDSLRQRPFGD